MSLDDHYCSIHKCQEAEWSDDHGTTYWCQDCVDGKPPVEKSSDQSNDEGWGVPIIYAVITFVIILGIIWLVKTYIL